MLNGTGTNTDVEKLLINLQLSHVIHYNLQQQQNSNNNTNEIIEICQLHVNNL